jgi:cell fate regulator YaaT (PSP1 superfamily)
MYDVVEIAIKSNKNYDYYSPNLVELKKGDMVIVNTENGMQVGIVKSNIKKVAKNNLDLPLKNVVRIVTDEDLKKIEDNDKDASLALKDAKSFAKELKLDMHFVDASYNFERSQLLFNFTADSRVDFRELAKKLAQKYRTRIELRQIGVRDKAKYIGGLGPCGLFLCCHTFLTDFNSVSINMAKNQFLALNPSKINGVCGRLLCCLGYEDELYTELKKDMPTVGMNYDTPKGMGRVVSIDIFKRTYKVDLGVNGVLEFNKGDSNGSSK